MTRIGPENVHSTLSRHMLLDGFDIVFDPKKSRGSRIYDARGGRWYLDFFTFFASSPVGYNHPKLTTPEFLDRLARAALHKPSNSDIFTVEMAEFVDTFARLGMPDYLPHLFLISGGALGIENALKTAFDWKIKKNWKKGIKGEKGTQVIHFRQAFHGRTGYTMSLTNTLPVKTDLYPKFTWPRVDNPKITFPLNEENLKKVEEAERRALAQVKQAILENRDDIAAIIIEPIQGEGGDNHFRGEFLRALREIADQEDLFLIFDEVQTGVGLTGRFWAHQHFDVKPDAMAFGKKTQVCGVLVGERVDEVEDNVFKVPNRLNSTFGGNLIDMVRFQKYLEIIHEEGLVENAARMGDYLLNKLLEVQAQFSSKITNARGRGLMTAFDVIEGTEGRDELLKRILNNGLVVLKCGDQTIRFRPPLNLTAVEIDEAMRILSKSLKEF
ncbi:L-lysine 6-transaminase [candidate division KSB1 bacterium]|nr:L-lysine 6-transaminase [candidate division KSB1 bacterium]